MKSIKFNYLIKNYKQDIYRFSFYMLKNKPDAEDITQEVLIKTWENIEKFEFSKAKSWIMKTTYNLCIDLIRKRKSADNFVYESEEDEDFELPDNDYLNNPLVKMENESLKERINEAIQNLPEKLKTIFVMYEINEMKYKEISDLLNIPINSVKVFLLRARKKLQLELQSYETK
jgi:RNA polymerase sigma-70 factor (ECF subfamily)